MAEAIARRDAPDAIDAFSAGLVPIGFVPELTKQTLMKNGYWMEGLESKGISSGVWERVDVVINMSGRPKKEAFREHSKVVDWEIEDPFERGPEDYQRVFDKIRARVGELAEEHRREYAANRIAERRSRPRLYPTSPMFMSLNGCDDARVVNVSEDGLALSSDVALPSRPLQNLRIQFPGPPRPLEARCQIVWKSSNNKQAGIQFDGLTAEARRFIRTWISAQAVCVGFRSQIERTREAQNATALAERRAKTRTPVNPPVYVDIENVNGGLVYNMTEDGIAMSAAMVLPGDSPLKLRIELPGAGGWIEAIGQIKWRSGSSKTVGIRLVGLSEETRKVIRNWLVLERSKPAPEPEFTPLTFVNTSKLAPGPHEETRILTNRSAGPVTESFPESIPLNTDEPAIRGASAAASQKSPRKIEPFAQTPVSDPLTSGARTKRYVGLSAVLTLAAVIAVAIAGIASLPSVRTEMGGYVAQSAPNVDKPNAEKAPLSPTKALDIHLQKTEAPPPIVDSPSPEKANDLRHDSSKGSSFTAAAQPAEKPSHSILLKAARGSLHNRPELQRPTNQTVRFAASVNSRPLKKPKLEAAASPPSVPPPLEVKMPQSANLVPTRPAEPRSDEPEDKAKQPVTAAQMTGEVSVVTDPYPSLRADERDSKKQKHGASLELGHLLSRVVPVYPEEAKRRCASQTEKNPARMGMPF
jgi:protein-tyrosine-phosphatase